MEKIKTGQLVRIKGFGKMDAGYRHPLGKLLIGKTGRFIPWRDSRMTKDVPWSLDDGKTYAGDFEYDPDVLDENKYFPAFASVIVEPVDES